MPAATGVRPVINSAAAGAALARGRGRALRPDGRHRHQPPWPARRSDLGDEAIAAARSRHADVASRLGRRRQLRRTRGSCGCFATGHGADQRTQRRSLANSAGIALGADYALRPHPAGPCALWRRSARRTRRGISARSPIRRRRSSRLRDLAPGDAVGYNATLTADRPMRVGDGLARLCRRFPALLGRARVPCSMTIARLPIARQGFDGHGRRRLQRCTDTQRRRLARRSVSTCRMLRSKPACRNMNC